LTAKEQLHKLTACSLSDVGRVRDHNEDAFFTDTERRLFIVSDGMGGAQAGSLASEVVVKMLPKMIEERADDVGELSSNEIRLFLRRTIIELSQLLRKESKNALGIKGMGATVVLAMVHRKHVYIAHMGDSRGYLFRNSRLTRLTKDHSIVGILLRHGDITEEEAKKHPAKGRLSRYVGMEGEIYPDVRAIIFNKGDRLLLCTDGLSGMLSDKAIEESLQEEHSDPQAACRALVEAANTAGGEDNISVVIVDFEK
jgi:protein phosphatase